MLKFFFKETFRLFRNGFLFLKKSNKFYIDEKKKNNSKQWM